MKTNFFEQVAGLKIDGSLLLNITTDKNGLMSVSAMLSKAGTIPPMVFTALSHELDEAFFDKLIQPVALTKGLITNLETYKKELDKAKKQPGKDGKATTTPASTEEPDEDDDDAQGTGDLFSQQPDDSQLKAEKKQYVDDQLIKAKELAKQMKYVEALAQLPDPAEYKEQAELIEAKRAEIQKGKEVYDQLQEQFKD